jgi:hypothetical protein
MVPDRLIVKDAALETAGAVGHNVASVYGVGYRFEED